MDSEAGNSGVEPSKTLRKSSSQSEENSRVWCSSSGSAPFTPANTRTVLKSGCLFFQLVSGFAHNEAGRSWVSVWC